MSQLLQRVEASIQQHRLLPRGKKILVAVSGGADSMVLLHALHILAKANRWSLSVAHFNHRLRGRAGNADEAFVRRAATKLRLPFFSERGDVAGFAAQSKLSVEMAARKLRHEFLARVARQEKISVIALAHHADDQVELFFLRLLRGAGGEGLAGMKWRSASPVDKTITLVRPLLGLTKAELLAQARENKIRFRHDASNDSTDFLRNRIRNELLPLLRKNYQPAVDRTVLRLMDIVGAEAEFAGSVASSLRLDTVPPQAERYNFGDLPVAIQRRVLQSQLAELGVTTDFELVEQLRAAPGKFVSVGSDLSVARNLAGKVQLENLSLKSEAKFKAGELKLKLSVRAGQVEFTNRKFSWTLGSFSGLRGRSPHQPGTEFFDADKIGGEIILRHWRAGDRFQPIGLKSAVKLQDLFVNAKIPAARRRELVLATTGAGEIFWVEGLRIGEKFKLAGQTRCQFVWKQSKMAA